ncbi:hypothetical protein O181_020540 [Austropuccinia psidii MF-1]|uniref:Uncharacterized protein n=1 Tax=Austropuccinia psidii MF-1 TaxID=1389203 RepID=A0A9Q3CDY8_9BASI|nr:hypothetical protein [Austropuccinia psidii MF-1]
MHLKIRSANDFSFVCSCHTYEPEAGSTSLTFKFSMLLGMRPSHPSTSVCRCHTDAPKPTSLYRLPHPYQLKIVNLAHAKPIPSYTNLGLHFFWPSCAHVIGALQREEGLALSKLGLTYGGLRRLEERKYT